VVVEEAPDLQVLQDHLEKMHLVILVEDKRPQVLQVPGEPRVILVILELLV
jgi:hypothetical protein